MPCRFHEGRPDSRPEVSHGPAPPFGGTGVSVEEVQVANSLTVAPSRPVGNALWWPGLVSIVFGIHAIVDGVAAGSQWFSARRDPRPRRHSGWILAGAVISVLAGLVAPGLTALAVALFVGAWAMMLGITEVVVAIAARWTTSCWWAGLVSGILALLFGLAGLQIRRSIRRA